MNAPKKRIRSIPVWLCSYDDEDLAVITIESGARRYAEIVSRKVGRPVHITATTAVIQAVPTPSVTVENGKAVE